MRGLLTSTWVVELLSCWATDGSWGGLEAEEMALNGLEQHLTRCRLHRGAARPPALRGGQGRRRGRGEGRGRGAGLREIPRRHINARTCDPVQTANPQSQGRMRNGRGRGINKEGGRRAPCKASGMARQWDGARVTHHAVKRPAKPTTLAGLAWGMI